VAELLEDPHVSTPAGGKDVTFDDGVAAVGDLDAGDLAEKVGGDDAGDGHGIEEAMVEGYTGAWSALIGVGRFSNGETNVSPKKRAEASREISLFKRRMFGVFLMT
jgi:hypothetical protein